MPLHVPDRKVRGVNDLRKRMRASVGALGCLLAVAACGSSSTARIQTQHVATAIAGSVLSERHEHASVSCPTTVPLVVHSTFWCVSAVGKQLTPFEVTETDSSGHVTYVGVRPSQAPLIDATTVETAIRHSIESQRHLTDKVTCPVGVPRQKGLSFICIATPMHGTATQFEVSQTNSAGGVTYRGL